MDGIYRSPPKATAGDKHSLIGWAVFVVLVLVALAGISGCSRMRPVPTADLAPVGHHADCASPGVLCLP